MFFVDKKRVEKFGSVSTFLPIFFACVCAWLKSAIRSLLHRYHFLDSGGHGMGRVYKNEKEKKWNYKAQKYVNRPPQFFIKSGGWWFEFFWWRFFWLKKIRFLCVLRRVFYFFSLVCGWCDVCVLMKQKNKSPETDRGKFPPNPYLTEDSGRDWQRHTEEKSYPALNYRESYFSKKREKIYIDSFFWKISFLCNLRQGSFFPLCASVNCVSNPRPNMGSGGICLCQSPGIYFFASSTHTRHTHQTREKK